MFFLALNLAVLYINAKRTIHQSGRLQLYSSIHALDIEDHRFIPWHFLLKDLGGGSCLRVAAPIIANMAGLDRSMV